MKTPALGFAVLILLVPTVRAEKDLPKDVSALGMQRMAAITKVDKAYLDGLEKLKVRYTKAGDLESANAVLAEIQRARENLFLTILSTGKWRYQMKNGDIILRSFVGREMIDEQGHRFPVSISGEKIRIDWGGGAYEEMTVNLESPDIISGTNYQGGKFRYFR